MSRKKSNTQISNCYCGSNLCFEKCCQPYLTGQAQPLTAEALMRSRYSAYVLQNQDYLIHTWHEKDCPTDLDVKADPVKWLGLEIQETRAGREEDTEGWVRFIVRYKINGRASRMEENSYFVKTNGKWLYHSAESLG